MQSFAQPSKIVTSIALALLSAAMTHRVATAGVQTLINGDVKYDTSWGNTDPDLAGGNHYRSKNFRIFLSELSGNYSGSNLNLFSVSPCFLGGPKACNDFNAAPSHPTTNIPADPGWASGQEYELKWHNHGNAVSAKKSQGQHFGYEGTISSIPSHWLRAQLELFDGKTVWIPSQNRIQYSAGILKFASLPLDGDNTVPLAFGIGPWFSSLYEYSLEVEIRAAPGESTGAGALRTPLYIVARGANEPPSNVDQLAEDSEYIAGLPEIHSWSGLPNHKYEIQTNHSWPWIILETRWDSPDGQSWTSRFYTAHESSANSIHVLYARDSVPTDFFALLLGLSGIMFGFGYYISTRK